MGSWIDFEVARQHREELLLEARASRSARHSARVEKEPEGTRPPFGRRLLRSLSMDHEDGCPENPPGPAHAE